MTFANLYLFRVIRVKVPYPYSVRTWDCTNVEFLNIHNYSQVKYTTDNPLFDINTAYGSKTVRAGPVVYQRQYKKNRHGIRRQ